MPIKPSRLFLFLIFTLCLTLVVVQGKGFPFPLQSSDSDGVTALMRAARDGEYDNFKALLRQHTDVNPRDSWGWSALTYAAAKGNQNAVKDLISNGADVNAGDNDGYTPLMAAVEYKHSSIVKLLLSNGADVNVEDKDGCTALTVAARGRDKKVIELLQKAGARNPKPDAPPGPHLQIAGVTRPLALNRPRPSYTTKAREEKVQGIVFMRVLIGSDGTVQKARVLIGLPYGMSAQAVAAVSRLRFRPATIDGQPTQFWQGVEIEFKLQ
jgi:TonB family protein